MGKKNKDGTEEMTSPAEQSLAVDFDEWLAARQAKIPTHHYKEIIKADFKGRGLGNLHTMEEFDEALKKYGVKLN